MTEHAKRFPPSSGKRWMTCTASPGFIAQLISEGKLSTESRDSAASIQGTAAHEMLEALLEPHCNVGEPSTGDAPGEPQGFVGREMSNGYTLTQEDVNAVTVAYNYIMTRWREAQGRKPPFEGATAKLYVEHRVHPGKSLSPPIEDDLFGTLDVGIVGGGMVEVIDYKHGAGVLVSPADWQLFIYTIGLLKYLLPPEAQRVTQTVLQPRHRGWTLERASEHLTPDRVATVRDILQRGVTQAISGMGTFTPTEDACRFCPAKAHCSAYSQSALASVQAAFGAAPEPEPTPQVAAAPAPAAAPMSLDDLLSRPTSELSIEAKAAVYENASFIRGWLNAIEKDLYDLAISGTKVDRHKLVLSKRSRTVTSEEDYRKALSTATKRGKGKLRKDEYIEEKLISPAQAEARLKPLLTPKGWEKVEACITWSAGKPALVSENDPRPEYVTNAAQIFGPATQPEKELPDFLK